MIMSRFVVKGGVLGGLWFVGGFCVLLFFFLLALLVKKSHLFTKPQCPHLSPPPAELPEGGDPSVPGPLAGSFPYLHPLLAEDHFNK